MELAAEDGASSKYTAFIANSHEGRPPHGAIAAFQKNAETLGKGLANTMSNAESGIRSVASCIDEVGPFWLVTFSARVSSSHAKTNIGSVMSSVAKKMEGAVEETQFEAVAAKLRPFDELDRDRVAEMHTIASLKPKFPPKTPKKRSGRNRRRSATSESRRESGTMAGINRIRANQNTKRCPNSRGGYS